MIMKNAKVFEKNMNIIGDPPKRCQKTNQSAGRISAFSFVFQHDAGMIVIMLASY